jgi:hypothetical protein
VQGLRPGLNDGEEPKNELKPWQKQEWCIPPEQDAAFVCQMEEVLDIYKTPFTTVHFSKLL